MARQTVVQYLNPILYCDPEKPKEVHWDDVADDYRESDLESSESSDLSVTHAHEYASDLESCPEDETTAHVDLINKYAEVQKRNRGICQVLLVLLFLGLAAAGWAGVSARARGRKGPRGDLVRGGAAEEARTAPEVPGGATAVTSGGGDEQAEQRSEAATGCCAGWGKMVWTVVGAYCVSNGVFACLASRHNFHYQGPVLPQSTGEGPIINVMEHHLVHSYTDANGERHGPLRGTCIDWCVKMFCGAGDDWFWCDVCKQTTQTFYFPTTNKVVPRVHRSPAGIATRRFSDEQEWAHAASYDAIRELTWHTSIEMYCAWFLGGFLSCNKCCGLLAPAGMCSGSTICCVDACCAEKPAVLGPTDEEFYSNSRGKEYHTPAPVLGDDGRWRIGGDNPYAERLLLAPEIPACRDTAAPTSNSVPWTGAPVRPIVWGGSSAKQPVSRSPPSTADKVGETKADKRARAIENAKRKAKEKEVIEMRKRAARDAELAAEEAKRMSFDEEPLRSHS